MTIPTLTSLSAAASVVLLAAPGAGAAEDPPPPPSLHLSIWCEFMPYREAAEHLPLLARYDCDLLLHVERATLGDPDFTALCREAERLGVGVAPWFLLPLDQHIYLGEDTLDLMELLIRDFLDWSGREGLRFEWAVLDCEPSYLQARRMTEDLRRGNLLGVGRALREQKDPARFAESARRMAGLIDHLHQRGTRVIGSINRFILDSLAAGDLTVQDTLNAPFTMLPWDRATFIMYRYKASHEQYLAMVHRYSALGRRFFGDRAGLDLGLIGDHRPVPGFIERAEQSGHARFYLSYLNGMKSALEFGEAVGVARGRGVRHLDLFSLDGAVHSVAGLENWLKAAAESRPLAGLESWTPWQSVKLSAKVRFYRCLFRALVGRARYEIPTRPPPPDERAAEQNR